MKHPGSDREKLVWKIDLKKAGQRNINEKTIK
jgi:hypothetical protein